MLAVAVINLSLGYVVALALVGPRPWERWNLRLLRRRYEAVPRQAHSAAADGKQQSPVAASSDDATVARSLIAGLDELPADWLSQLAGQGIVAQTFLEASAHVLRLEIGRYREQLVAAESRTRMLFAQGSTSGADAESLRHLADELRYINQDWLDKQTAAADMLAQRSGRLGDQELAAAALEQVLLDQAAQVRAACGMLQSLDVASELALRGKQLMEQITALLVQAHALRDRIVDLLATLMRVGETLDEFGGQVQRDMATALPNRIGLESLLAGWWRDDPQRTRMLSAVLIDIDRFGRINQRLGTRSGDRAIVAASRLIDETLAKDKGFERLVRIGGEAFLVLLGDVGPHQALTAAERLRQAIEATTFDDEGTEFDLTISCGVIEVKHDESNLDLVRRVLETARFAKKAGRNRCALDKGEGPAMLDPPQFPVKGRIISLRAAALESLAQPVAASAE
jgi:diguanylate cyclase